MKKIRKNATIIILLAFALITLVNSQARATNDTAKLFEKTEYSEDFKKWLELSDEEKQKVIMPKMYETENSEASSKNPLRIAKMLKASMNSKYSLKDVIPSNLLIRNQQQTNSCWAFAALSSVETNLALYNYRKGEDLSKVYDFSERHMEYATSKTFANNVENKSGYNRKVGSGGNYCIAQSYLTNGSGAIPESEMPFENNENIIDISKIQNKTISSQVYDTIEFKDYMNQTDEKKVEIMNQIKQHIQNYGSVYANIHGNSPILSTNNCYNSDTGSMFCNDQYTHTMNHAVSIIGWDDNYSIDNFLEEAKPKSNGAWIVRNSWGERLNESKLSELKEEIFNTYEQQCIAQGWNSAEEIPNEFIEQNGYTIENDIAYIKYGNNGIIYISYEDVNVSKAMFGIVKATDTVNYDYIYQYDEFYPSIQLSLNGSNMMLCNVFNKKTKGTEYLTQVSLFAPETYTCKVYVNPNGTSKSKSDLQLVSLKAGESETFNTGYHTLEFAKPIEIKANSFAVVVEIQSSKYSTNFALESKVDGVETWNSVTVENGKCFVAPGNNLENCQWTDLSKLTEQNSSLVNGDSTIKAYTTTELLDGSLKNIEITTPPTKTSYFEGENFEKTGMVVKANYNSRTNPSAILDDSSYSITNGTNLKVGQTSVTITYEDKSVNQTINVEKNSVVELKIKTPPNKTEYKEGQKFDTTGMVVEATYKNGTTKTISDYTIENGNNLKADQTQVIISYEEKTIGQPITVIPNPLMEIKVTKAPNKVKYVVGQNFDKTGMIVTGTYKDDTTQEILDYTVENGTNLKKEQSLVTIKYEGKTTTQPITVEEKAIVEISVGKKPTKLKYIQNEENLDLTGGNLKITYNDGTTENVLMSSDEVKIAGFDNTKSGKIIITVTYQDKKTQFELEIIEADKAENSNLNNARCYIKKVEAYYYTDSSQKDYVLINVEINNISRILTNDSVEYYYSMSSNVNEQNINTWVKIEETQESNDKLQFTINSRNVPNYDEVENEEVVYIYVKEVATKGGNQSVYVSNSMKLETDNDIEVHMTHIGREEKEDTKLNGTSANDFKDNTIAAGRLPNTGIKIAITILTILILSMGILGYIKYRELNKYVK